MSLVTFRTYLTGILSSLRESSTDHVVCNTTVGLATVRVGHDGNADLLQSLR